MRLLISKLIGGHALIITWAGFHWVATLLFVVIKKVAEDFSQSLEQIGFAATVFADEYIDKTVIVEAQRKIPQVFIMTDGEQYQAHNDFLYLRHYGA